MIYFFGQQSRVSLQPTSCPLVFPWSGGISHEQDWMGTTDFRSGKAMKLRDSSKVGLATIGLPKGRKNEKNTKIGRAPLRGRIHAFPDSILRGLRRREQRD